MDAETLVMGDVSQELGEDMEEEEKVEDEVVEPEPIKAKKDWRSTYWEVIHEEQKRLTRQNPDMAAKEVLKRARAAPLGVNEGSF